MSPTDRSIRHDVTITAPLPDRSEHSTAGAALWPAGHAPRPRVCGPGACRTAAAWSLFLCVWRAS